MQGIEQDGVGKSPPRFRSLSRDVGRVCRTAGCIVHFPLVNVAQSLVEVRSGGICLGSMRYLTKLCSRKVTQVNMMGFARSEAVASLSPQG